MEPAPRLSSGPAASCLARADRPWHPTSSSRPNCYPQRPYYRFYYGRPGIIAGISTRLAALGVPVVRAGEISGSHSPTPARLGHALAVQPRVRCVAELVYR